MASDGDDQGVHWNAETAARPSDVEQIRNLFRARSQMLKRPDFDPALILCCRA